MIELKNVKKEYDNGFVALKNINLHCNEGEITALIGPSGCGKTTLMKLINRLDNPTKGSVSIKGKDISKIDPVELRRSIGYVIQQIGLFPHMNIARNVGTVPKLLKWDKERIKNRVDELLELVSLDPEIYRERFPSELSGGQQQRIGVIRALAAEPSVILMDEPFSALDPISREQLQDELVRLQREIKKSIVFVTHDMDEALKIADRIVLMKSGEIVQHGTPEEILRHPANAFVEEFIGQKRLERFQDIPPVSQVMVKRPITVTPNRGLAESMRIMEDKKVDSLIVVDEMNHLLGYITVFDVVKAYSNEYALVKHIMHSFNTTVEPDTLLPDAIQLMTELQTPYLPVVKEKGILEGLLTRGSIVGFIGSAYPSIKEGAV
ncbi:glycine/betaine ABC transporter ATP-binding protein [Virgibacillus profundi]|uniref:Quaternary amine transport ATP-binding protein n=1 Tax=Virgibacillus profundi TaxID=2024555 RepID=A0A2A2IE27_9BACI|nr:betaine/proline/choline family ABC transporter ATP-binding protein [Virgibacillus profundi]PAV29618.1 glycine/betaine ABC transporter ATP-binding protein [Virgibacillus profundi]PXY53790.1 CBS domain-containing protein [Virgibacillus profundi]